MAERTGRKKVGRETGRKAYGIHVSWRILRNSEHFIRTDATALENIFKMDG